uniref:Uncharacterized protein n=1 Tax=Glossina pallidipes TaxID=7398 RepID=A0A1A9ZNL5_GLOPL
MEKKRIVWNMWHTKMKKKEKSTNIRWNQTGEVRETLPPRQAPVHDVTYVNKRVLLADNNNMQLKANSLKFLDFMCACLKFQPQTFHKIKNVDTHPHPFIDLRYAADHLVITST